MCKWSDWVLIGLLFPTSVIAENANTISGYIDGSYNYLVRSNQFTSGDFNRIFDLEPNGFTLQQAGLTLAHQPKEGVGILFNPILGRDANTTAAYGWNPYFGSQTLALDPVQGYLQYAQGPFTFIGGKFITLPGQEFIDPTLDTNFSRNIVGGYSQPGTMLGIRGTYAVNDKANLIAGLNNGWDNIRDFSRRKTIELAANYTPNKTFAFATTFYSGGQRATDRTATGSESIRDMLDFLITYTANDKLTLVADLTYANQTLSTLPSGNVAEAVWQGIAGYANYKFNDTWLLSFRPEIFSDRNGYRTGVVQCWKEVTLTLGYSPTKNIEFHLETRHDFSNVSSFVNKNNAGTNNNQQSYALEGYYKFSNK